MKLLTACFLCLASVAPCAELGIGNPVPDLILTQLDGKKTGLRSLEAAPITVLIFLSSQCPVSNEYVGRMNALARDYAGQATILGINSNRNEPPEQVRRHAADYRLAFPVYKDPDNVVADVFGITVTPEAVVLDSRQRLQYRGRIDDQQKIARVTRSDLRRALEAVLAGRPAPVPETKAFGCTLKRVERAALDLGPIDEAGYRSLLESHRGKVVLVSFWATWCEPCREEMPALAALQTRLRDQGFALITISADEAEQRESAGEFLVQHGVSAPAYLKQAHDDDAFIRSVNPEWSGALPALFLYDPAGRLVRSFIGETKIETLEPAVADLMPPVC